MIAPFLASHNHIDYIRRDISVQLRTKNCLYYFVESTSYVPKTLCHFDEAICAERGSEAGLVFFTFIHPDLMISEDTHHL